MRYETKNHSISIMHCLPFCFEHAGFCGEWN